MINEFNMEKLGTRRNEPPEKLEEMFAHEGICRYCNGPVKMWRDQKTLVLLPELCFCIVCSQKYFMEIDDLEAWEAEQWRQKDSKP